MRLPPITSRIDHRDGLLPHGTPAYPPPCFDRLGPDAVSRFVDALYDGIESDPVVRPAFNRDLTKERLNQKSFFTAWLGGPRSYFDGWRPGLLERHERISISRGMADRWLGHFRRALQEASFDPALVDEVFPVAERIAYSLVSRSSEPRKGERLRGSCSTLEIRTAEHLLARRDLDGLSRLFHADEALRKKGPRLLVSATARGAYEAVEVLLDNGVDPNRAIRFGPSDAKSLGLPAVPVTALCAAAKRNRQEACDVLAERGARYDIFSAICLLDIASVQEVLNIDPNLATAADPADDLAEITVLYHAVAAGSLDLAGYLLKNGAIVGPNSARLIQIAANSHNEPLTDLLLLHRADPIPLSVGNWVAHRSIAQKLIAIGADVNREPGKWIGLACTGNSGHREKLPLARALLDWGADVDAVYRGRPAVHHAAQAGFTEILKLLVERGADPSAVDEKGLTALDAVESAAKTVDRETTRAVLRSLGAR